MLPVVLHIEVPERTNDTKRTDRVDRVPFRKRAIAGLAIDNVMIERLWRTVKYENIYIKEYASGADCHQRLQAYFQYYCHERLTRACPIGHPGTPTKPLAAHLADTI